MSAEIDRENSKPFRDEHIRLWAPTLLVEPAAMSEHDGAGPLPIQICADTYTVFRDNRYALLGSRQRAQNNSDEKHGTKHEHAGIIRC